MTKESSEWEREIILCVFLSLSCIEKENKNEGGVNELEPNRVCNCVH